MKGAELRAEICRVQGKNEKRKVSAIKILLQASATTWQFKLKEIAKDADHIWKEGAG